MDPRHGWRHLCAWTVPHSVANVLDFHVNQMHLVAS